ncbi:MAG: T9SS type A sorting domain-containing protein, partial [Calditrichales bacterium]
HPENFRLNQNYPNPFNPETTIPFELVSAGHVRLDIYDTSGQHITSLVDNYLSPGFYTAHFNADHLASGIYYYRLQNHINFQTRRMILIK